MLMSLEVPAVPLFDSGQFFLPGRILIWLALQTSCFSGNNLELFVEVTSSEDLLKIPTKLWKVIYIHKLESLSLEISV